MQLDDFYIDNLAQKIESHFLSNLEYIPRDTAHVVAKNYVLVVMDEIIRNYYKRNEHDRKLGLHNVSLTVLRNKCKRYGPRGKQKYWWDLLHKISPLINIVEVGNNLNERVSSVQALFECDWDNGAKWAVKEQYEADPTQYDVVEIDLINLGHYLLQAKSFYKHKPTLANVLKKGQDIIDVADQFSTDSEHGLLPMLRMPAASGRMYYGGINLQNCPAGVRHAALGRHFSYDLKRSVFAWQISMLRLIVGENVHGVPDGTSYTREFIRERESVVAQLAPTLVDSMYGEDQIPRKIKEVITAIGFGGRRAGGFVNTSNKFIPKGLASIITHKESRERLLAHPWMKNFIAEQDAIIDVITTAMLEQDPGWKTDPRTFSKGRYSKKVFISFLYQQTEARVMQGLMKHFADKQVLLWVHDGFCTRHRISVTDAKTIMELDYHMRDWVLEETFHKGWDDPSAPKLTPEEQRLLNEQQDRAERAERIRAETEMWASRGVDTRNWHNIQRVLPKFKENHEGHYNDGVSDYDAGRDPYANGSRGLLSEQQFIESIYRKI